MRRLDWIPVCLLVLVGLGLLLLPREVGGTFTVTCDGEVLGTYPLGEDRVIPVETSFGSNVLTVSGGAVSVTEADCPGGDCTHTASVSRAGETIVCLPHRLIVSVNGASEGPDAVTGGAK